MRLILVFVLMVCAGNASAFSYATGGCADGCANGESWVYTNANEVDTALDNVESRATTLEGKDTIAEHQTVESINVILATEIDDKTEINAIVTGDDVLFSSDLGVTAQAYDADLADLADGSLSGSKIGTGLDATTITTGTIGSTARLPAAVIELTEIDTTTELNALMMDEVFLRATDTVDIEITGTAQFTGTLNGMVRVRTISATTDSPDYLATSGDLHICTNAGGCDITLPAASAGRNACWYDSNGGGVITLDPATTDRIILDGVTQPLEDAIDSAGDQGDFICILAIDSTYWITLGRSGTFIPGGAD